MTVIKNTLCVGATEPFVFLHVSDIHVARADETESPQRRALAEKRTQDFPFASSAVEFIKEYVKKTGYSIVGTGDVLDFVTPEAIRVVKDLIQETNMMVVAGNHEFLHCYKNRFHYDDLPEAYATKDETLAYVGKSLERDIRFSCREINGVNFVCIDDTNYRIDRELFEKLKEVEGQGKPILLFMHIPIYSEHLGPGAKYSICAPAKYLDGCTPMEVLERATDAQTYAFCDYIRKSPLIHCVFSGHIHYNVEILGKDGQNQIITGLDTIREITVV